jgi:protoheme IX farnesyltransferase
VGIVSYNFIYTPLKTKSMLAILPGAVCGMLPPCIGWLAAGGKIDSITLWSIMALFGLWQLPHFWLILLLYPQDYVGSNVPSLLNVFSDNQVRKVVFNWILVFAVMTLSLPLANAVLTGVVRWLLVLNAACLVSNFAYQFFLKTEQYNYKTLLVHLNASLILIMGLGALDRLILFCPRIL